MRHYEVMIVLAPDLAEDGFNKQLEQVRGIIENGGGTVVNDDRWGIRSLAYQIGKHDQGFYSVIEWESNPEVIAELDHTLRLEEKVLRHMVLHLDQTALEEQAEARARASSGPPADDKAPLDVDDAKKDEVAIADAPEVVDEPEAEAAEAEAVEEPEPAEAEAEAVEETEPAEAEEVVEEAEATGDEADDVEEAEEEKS